MIPAFEVWLQDNGVTVYQVARQPTKDSRHLHSLNKSNVGLVTDLPDRLAAAAISYKGINLRKMADPDRSGAFELRGVGNEDNVARICHDRLGYLHFAKIKIQQRAVVIDRRCADYREINLELLDEVDRSLPDDAPVSPPDHTARDYDLDRRVDSQAIGNVYVIGNNHKSVMVEQRLTNRLGRRADVYEERRVVRYYPSGRSTDRRLLFGRDFTARLVLHILDSRGKQRAPVDASQEPAIAQFVEIFSHGLRRHPKSNCKVIYENAPIVPGEFDDF
jgi:hypothetical protein